MRFPGPGRYRRTEVDRGRARDEGEGGPEADAGQNPQVNTALTRLIDT